MSVMISAGETLLSYWAQFIKFIIVKAGCLHPGLWHSVALQLLLTDISYKKGTITDSGRCFTTAMDLQFQYHQILHTVFLNVSLFSVLKHTRSFFCTVALCSGIQLQLRWFGPTIILCHCIYLRNAHFC